MNNELTGALGRLGDVYRQLGTREPTNAIEAQAVIENIRAEKGYLDEETLQDLQNLSEQSRDRLLRIVKLKRETEAAYTTNISEQLYSSKFRFLYELIQNADDSSYPLFSESSPYLRFEVTPDAMVIETNEYGFKRANIEAICATGRSSKKAAASDDHIGEKGFGFKSVFSVSDEVRIQSGLWSFCFQHRRGEDGLGMITPLDIDPEVLPLGVTTRITLRYSVEAKQEYTRLLEAIQDLPHSTIIFLQRLQTIHINITDLDNQYKKTSFTKRYDSKPSLRCTLTQSMEAGGTRNSESCTYLLFRTTKGNMPPHERRQGRTEAKIELAFPIDPATGQPKLSEQGQHVFAYLPLQRLAQVQFLIQSDFVTSASRESVIDCPWNDALCKGIAETFVSAVVDTFAKPNHPLRHSWLDYLPQRMVDRPWKPLYTLITESLEYKPVAQTKERGLFKAPNQLRKLLEFTKYNNEPILPDLPEEIYLSSGYTSRHIERLQELGVSTMSWTEVLDRLSADLVRPQSRTKTTAATDSWHVAFAEMFQHIFKHHGSEGVYQERLRRLAIVPLTKPNQWSGCAGYGNRDPIYFAFTGSTPIPDRISLRLLDRTASKNATRKAFYESLGVKECPKETVFAEIKKAHQGSPTSSEIIEQLRYMFHQGYNTKDVRSWAKVPIVDGDPVTAYRNTIFFPSDGEFDMYQLVPRKLDKAYVFLSDAILNAELPTVRVNNETWKKWLSRAIGAGSCPKLKAGGLSKSVELSSEIEAVLTHSPTKFLATLRAHWDEYQKDAFSVAEALRNCSVPCQSGSMKPLQYTYLPTIAVSTEVRRLKLDEKTLPLLDVGDISLDEATHRSWKFLEEFGVKSAPGLEFYRLAIREKATKDTVPNPKEVADIYKCMARMVTLEGHDALRRDFDENPWIWDGNCSCWITRSECLWDGPDFICCKTVLTPTYSDDTLLASFFSTMLNIPSSKIEDIFEEIEQRRSGKLKHLSIMREIYTYLASTARSDEDWQLIKSEFMEKPLILGDNDTWYTLSACLWRSPFSLAGFQDLSTIYADLENFFVKRLRVKKASSSMLINEVKRMATATPPRIDDIRTRLIEIGMMLAKSSIDDNISKALTDLKEVKFLPRKVSQGTPVLVGVADDFAIPDHQRYANAFADHSVLLDFQIHEVQSLHVIFRHMGLTHRYLSSMVKELSTVGDSCNENETLSEQIQAKAYALYCCAAKYKSNKALRGDCTLYEQLSKALIYTTDEISTNLILPLAGGTISVRSDRAVIHSDISDAKIKVYVPSEARRRRACYRSQLPELLTDILDLSQAATFNVSSIIASALEDLEDILGEQDIPSVEWINKPVIVIPEPVEPRQPITPAPSVDDSDAATLFDPRSGLITPSATPPRHGRTVNVLEARDHVEATPPAQYPDFIDQVVRSAQRAGPRARNVSPTIADSAPEPEAYPQFDHQATFGTRDGNAFVHDRRIGAAGEAYAYEILSGLALPSFTEANWRSTIRGELARSTRFADMENWVGRETADIVYKDETGDLTRYLRANCEGSFPHQILQHWDFAAHPIEYYLEVKSTTGPCATRFYMSNGQYKRMESMALSLFQPTKVYVIMRVYDLMTPNVKMKIFVDPMRFKGLKLDFEADQWFVTTR